MKALSLSVPKQAAHSVSHDALNLPTLWPLVSALHLGYMQAANVYRHLGMIRESLYFAEQALKTVEAVGATPSIDKTKVMIGDLKVRGGQLSEGSEILDGIVRSLGDNRATAALELALGNLEKLRGDFSAELKAYQRAEKAIDELLDIKFIQKLGKVDDGQDDFVEQ
jgi:separase